MDDKPKLEEPKTWEDVKTNEEKYAQYLNKIEQKYIKIIEHINNIINSDRN